MVITLYGRIPSKKNSKTIVCRGRFPMLLSSTKYIEWHKDASAQLIGQKAIPTPCKLTIEFWFPDARKTDLSNKTESLLDLFVDNGIIPDDNCNEIQELLLIYRGIDRQNPRAQISWQISTTDQLSK